MNSHGNAPERDYKLDPLRVKLSSGISEQKQMPAPDLRERLTVDCYVNGERLRLGLRGDGDDERREDNYFHPCPERIE
jgi:hypothetical protein